MGGKFYLSVSTPRGPRRKYVGALGDPAVRLIREQHLERMRRRQERLAELAEARAEAAELEAILDAGERLANPLFAAAMITAGFHRHRRQWRRRSK